jgi:transposase-like protein
MTKAIGNVGEACRRSGMDRTSFYEWKRRFQTHGIAGWLDQPPIPRHQPYATPPGVFLASRVEAREKIGSPMQ